MQDKFDCCVIGGGPGGYVAAIRAAQCGMKVAIIERECLGGICLNWGCIPTKSLLRSAEVLNLTRHASDFGVITGGSIEPDLGAMVKRSRDISGRLNRGVRMLLKKNKVTIYFGSARLGSARDNVIVTSESGEEKKLIASHIIIATGARAQALPSLDMDNPLVWDYRKAMVPEACPKRLIVLGAGAIGVEFAYFYRALGSEVVLVEAQDSILPQEDGEISAMLTKELVRQGMEILTRHRCTAAKLSENEVEITLEHGNKTLVRKADRIIVAVGVRGNSEDLNLEAHGVRIEKSIIQTRGLGRTHAQGIYAIGDIAGPPMLAHKAEHEGVICVEAIAGLPNVHDLDKERIPGCTYCHPQVASVGLTEDQASALAKEKGDTIRVGRFPFIGNGKAMAMGETFGMVKTIFSEQSGRLLGAHMIGAEVTELIQGFVVAIGLETTETDLVHTVFPHPTLSEMMHESVLAAFGRAVHI